MFSRYLAFPAPEGTKGGDGSPDNPDSRPEPEQPSLLQREDSRGDVPASLIPPKADLPELRLEATAFNRSQLIFPEAAQAALAGRSNVGKSSLINALAGRKALAKVSATPGKTRSINYYRLQSTENFLVDLPGYGYAKCGHEERKKWAELLQYYFCNTPGLKSLVLLLDARLTPQNADKELMAYAAGLGLPVLAVLTKADKCGKKELAATLRAWEALVGKEALMVTSARSRAGIQELGRRLAAVLLGESAE